MKAFWVLAILMVAQVAHAEDKTQARAEFREGSRLYDISEFKEALKHFKNAYLIYEEPAFLFNIAQCYRQLGDNPEAVRSYRSFLNKMPNAPNRDSVQALINELQATIQKQNDTRDRAPVGPLAMDRPQPEAQVVVVTQDKPAYKKWWVWTIVGGVVVVGLGVGLGVGLSQSGSHFHTSLPEMGPGVSSMALRF